MVSDLRVYRLKFCVYLSSLPLPANLIVGDLLAPWCVKNNNTRSWLWRNSVVIMLSVCPRTVGSLRTTYTTAVVLQHMAALSNPFFVGESNENLKIVIKNGNFAPLSCKLVSMLQTACRMACSWQHSADARTPSQYQYKDGCPTWDLHQGRTAFCYSVFA